MDAPDITREQHDGQAPLLPELPDAQTPSSYTYAVRRLSEYSGAFMKPYDFYRYLTRTLTPQFSASSSPDTPRTKVALQVASSQLPAPQIAPRTKVVLESRQFSSSSSPDTPRILRVLKLYYKVASSQLPAPEIAPRTKVVLQSRQFSASTLPDYSAY